MFRDSPRDDACRWSNLNTVLNIQNQYKIYQDVLQLLKKQTWDKYKVVELIAENIYLIRLENIFTHSLPGNDDSWREEAVIIL